MRHKIVTVVVQQSVVWKRGVMTETQKGVAEDAVMMTKPWRCASEGLTCTFCRARFSLWLPPFARNWGHLPVTAEKIPRMPFTAMSMLIFIWVLQSKWEIKGMKTTGSFPPGKLWLCTDSFQGQILFMKPETMSSLTDQDQSRVPANLIGQVFGPVARVLGGVFTRHVAGGEDVTAQLPWVLRTVGVISDHPAYILQHLAVWKTEREIKKLVKSIVWSLYIFSTVLQLWELTQAQPIPVNPALPCNCVLSVCVQ